MVRALNSTNILKMWQKKKPVRTFFDLQIAYLKSSL